MASFPCYYPLKWYLSAMSCVDFLNVNLHHNDDIQHWSSLFVCQERTQRFMNCSSCRKHHSYDRKVDKFFQNPKVVTVLYFFIIMLWSDNKWNKREDCIRPNLPGVTVWGYTQFDVRQGSKWCQKHLSNQKEQE